MGSSRKGGGGVGSAGVMRLSVEAEPATLHWLGRAGSTGPEAAAPGAGGRSAAVEATQDRHYGGLQFNKLNFVKQCIV